MTLCDLFTSDFARAFWANFLAGALLIGGYLIQRWHARKDERDRVGLVRKAVLQEIRRELAHDAEQLEILIDAASEDPPGIPFPLFDVNGWDLLQQHQVLAALSPTTLEHLVKTYNRLRTANEWHRQVAELMYGPIGSVVANVIHAMPPGMLRTQAVMKFSGQMESHLTSLVDRVTELKAVLESARVAVDGELKNVGGV